MSKRRLREAGGLATHASGECQCCSNVHDNLVGQLFGLAKLKLLLEAFHQGKLTFTELF